MRRWWIALLLLLAACSPGNPPAASSPKPSPEPTASPTLLFAALEASVKPFQWDMVAIAGLDGYARARTTFTPMPIPYVGCGGAVPPPSAHVAAGKVYFADGTGMVTSLSPQGQVATVATFPFTGGQQQMVSFAVSPDGSNLLAAVFTLPGRATSGDPCSGAPAFAVGTFTLDVYSAIAGGASHLLYHEILPTSSTQPAPNVMAFMGWDKVGPEAASDTQWATQGGGPHPYGFMAWVDPSTGKITRQVSNPDSCLVWDIGAGGDFVCTILRAGDVSVRRPDGAEIWGFKASPNLPYQNSYLSPDETRVVAGGSETAVLSSTGDLVALTGFDPLGWLDGSTVIGGGYDRDLTYVRLSAPGTVVDIGFKGMFVGVVQG